MDTNNLRLRLHYSRADRSPVDASITMAGSSSSLPAPIYRHAAPSGPWPWVDFDADSLSDDSSSQVGNKEYPQNLFGNWTPPQVERSKMLTQCALSGCVVYSINVMDNGEFKLPQGQGQSGEQFLLNFPDKAENVRVRALFVDNLTKPVLKMLGTRYNIEPFFFSSSTNWIPSRYQEDDQDGDHITVILPFVRTTKQKDHTNLPSSSGKRKHTIDVLAPLLLREDRLLLIDLLAVHLVRKKDSSTIITYHPSLPGRTTAKRLHQVMGRAGKSVYWTKIFTASKDPTFFFLAILWYALYAWDEAFEVLYLDITHLEAGCHEIDAPDSSINDNDLRVTHTLHSYQAHLLQYQSLLRDFQKSVAFVRDTPCHAMECSTEGLMNRECENLLSEIDRLDRKCWMFISRLKNATDLAFATVNIGDSRRTQRDSAAMKQISYLGMVFLPASFTASVFGMNVAEINPGSLETIARYVEVTLLLTFATTWVVVALQPYSSFHERGDKFWQRLAWPAVYIYRKFVGICPKQPTKLTAFLWSRESIPSHQKGSCLPLTPENAVERASV